MSRTEVSIQGQPRGVRNNNPLNIKHVPGQEWYGQIGVDWIDLDDHAKGGYCIFKFPWQGYRAGFVTMKTYQRLRLAADGSAIDTVSEIIQRWAPRVPSGTENPHQALYISFVRRKMGVAKGEHVDVEDYKTVCGLVDAMVYFECGVEKPFGRLTKQHLHRGAIEADIEPPKDTASMDTTLKATKVAGVGGAAAVAAPFALESVTPALPFLTRVVEIAPWVIGAIAGVALIYAGYRIWRGHRSGV